MSVTRSESEAAMGEVCAEEGALAEIWKDDLLDRRADAEFLVGFLTRRARDRKGSGRAGSYVLNLDAQWGTGKTFFLRHLEHHLRTCGHLVAYINAWEDDHADDPLLPVIASLDDSLEPLLASNKSSLRGTWNMVKRNGAAIALAAGKGLALHWIRKASGETIDAITDAALAQSDVEQSADAAADTAIRELSQIIDERAALVLASFQESQRTIASFRANTSRLLKDILDSSESGPLFVLIDELDRCRPTYSLALLERVKHLFSIDNVVFIIATDASQLTHTLSVLYGQNFDSARYLRRFFDRTYQFDEPDLDQFIRYLVQKYDLGKNLSLPDSATIDQYLIGISRFFKLSLRDVEQCVDLLDVICTMWDLEIPLETFAIMPLIVGFHFGLIPELSPDFETELIKRSSAVERIPYVWTFEFGSYHSMAGPMKRSTPTGLNMFTEFRTLSQTFFSPREETNVSSSHQAWILKRLNEEQRVRTLQGQKQAGMRSIIEGYPALVRKAGRLVSTELE